jgi:hypothetical protein
VLAAPWRPTSGGLSRLAAFVILLREGKVAVDKNTAKTKADSMFQPRSGASKRENRRLGSVTVCRK